MKKIILYIAASLDQCIAEPDGGLEWLTEFRNPEKIDYGNKEQLFSADTVIMGGQTYREFLNMDVIWPYSEHMTYVVSHHNWGEKDNIRFITKDIIETISRLKKREGKNILLVGGGLMPMLLAENLIDEIHICYIPIILGKGIPLFSNNGFKESNWTLIKSTTYSSGIIKIDYKSR